MADERCTWRMDGRRPDARTTLDTCVLGGRATVPAHQRRQPPRSYPNDADHRAGRPPPPRYMGLIAGHPVPGPSPVTARSRCDTHYTSTALRCALRCPFPASLIHYRKPSSRPGYLRLHRVGVAAVSFCKHGTGLQRKRG